MQTFSWESANIRLSSVSRCSVANLKVKLQGVSLPFSMSLVMEIFRIEMNVSAPPSELYRLPELAFSFLTLQVAVSSAQSGLK